MQQQPDANLSYLLDQLLAVVPLRVRGSPPYVYIETQALDEAEAKLLALEPVVRAMLPHDQRKGLYDPRPRKRGRLIARVILRANGYEPQNEQTTHPRRKTTRWRLAPLDARQHAKYLWPALDAHAPAQQAAVQ
jgi:hypothetical protein